MPNPFGRPKLPENELRSIRASCMLNRNEVKLLGIKGSPSKWITSRIRQEIAEKEAQIAAITGVTPVRHGINLWDDDDLIGAEIENSLVHSVEDIMERDGVSRNEALLIQQDEDAAEYEAERKVEREARESARILREAQV